jgi:hypothetical protein
VGISTPGCSAVRCRSKRAAQEASWDAGPCISTAVVQLDWLATPTVPIRATLHTDGIHLAGRQETGAASGRVLDDLIRHAHVLGMEDFTRTDALATAGYRNDFKQYKCDRGAVRTQRSQPPAWWLPPACCLQSPLLWHVHYFGVLSLDAQTPLAKAAPCVVGRRYIAELRAVWPEASEPPAKGTTEYERVVELVSSFRQLLSIFLADATDTARQSAAALGIATCMPVLLPIP